MENNYKETLAVKLHEIDAIKFGNTIAESGLIAPIYFDIYAIFGHPDVMVRYFVFSFHFILKFSKKFFLIN